MLPRFCHDLYKQKILENNLSTAGNLAADSQRK